MKFFFMLTIVFCLVACGEAAPKNGTTQLNNGSPNNGSSDAGSTDTGTVSDATSLPDLIVQEGGPVFVNLSATPNTITEGDNITITAQLTDPDGFEDIGGGRVLDAAGNVYGSFTGSGGSYEFATSWSEINAIDSINFETSASLDLIAEFFDAGGLKSQKIVTVQLTCEGGPACDGVCGLNECEGACLEAFDTGDNCGGCGVVCAAEETCVDEACSEKTANYLSLCDTASDCEPVVECVDVIDGEFRCFKFCETDNDCGPGAKCLRDICAVDCTNNANACDVGLQCETFNESDIDVCIPRF